MFSLGGAGLMVILAILSAAHFFHFSLALKGARSDTQPQYTQDKPHDATGTKPIIRTNVAKIVFS